MDAQQQLDPTAFGELYLGLLRLAPPLLPSFDSLRLIADYFLLSLGILNGTVGGVFDS